MIYSNSAVRQQNSLLEEQEAKALLLKGEYGVLSMVDSDGRAYGIPISYAWDGEGSLYLHGALEGRKLRCLSQNNPVSFCVVGHTQVLPQKFSTEYESIILEGTAIMDLPVEEKLKGLICLVEKYSPEFKEKGLQCAEGSQHETVVIRLDIEHWSGKCRISKR